MTKPPPRLLLVEGKEDKLVIPQFMEKFIPWGEWYEPDKWPAIIKYFDGIEPLLKPGVIEAELKSPGLKALVSRTVTHNKRFPLISEDLSQILW